MIRRIFKIVAKHCLRGTPKNSVFFVCARKYRTENRSIQRVYEDSSTAGTQPSRKKRIFRGAVRESGRGGLWFRPVGAGAGAAARCARLCFGALSLVCLCVSATTPPRAPMEFAEQQLLGVLSAIAGGAGDQAYTMANTLVQEYPNFQLAQLVYADLLSAQGSSPVLFNDSRRDGLKNLRAEANARMLQQDALYQDELVAASLLLLSDSYRHALVFDMEKSRVYLFANQNGRPKLIEDYYMSIGKAGIGKDREGDNKTPIGVYRITSHLNDEQLPELYGAGAYPINYPNAWDQIKGRTGYGIWLHGVPRATYSRPPLDSEGCMVVSNINLLKIGERMDLGKTPVILTRSVRWVEPGANDVLRDTIQAQFEDWKRDWMSRKSDAYLSHYSKNFSTERHDYDSWQLHKRRVAASKSFIKVDTSEVDMFIYPTDQSTDFSADNAEMINVRFAQNYQSNNYQSNSIKQQLWRKESDGQWRIIYEGA